VQGTLGRGASHPERRRNRVTRIESMVNLGRYSRHSEKASNQGVVPLPINQPSTFFQYLQVTNSRRRRPANSPRSLFFSSSRLTVIAGRFPPFCPILSTLRKGHSLWLGRGLFIGTSTTPNARDLTADSGPSNHRYARYACWS
jgi:hypothetical protein